jgi:D-galactarolactone cycloisomerase
MDRRTFLGSAAGIGTRAWPAAVPAAELRLPAPLKIANIESFIVRDPPDRGKSEDEFVSMPPMGNMTGGIGLWNRLERSETVRQNRYQQSLLVRVTTDQGITGWGEAHAVTTPRAVKTVIADLFKPILIGQDARNIEPIWEKMYSTERLRGYGSGYWMRAIGGIDIALWDILGKALGAPVWQLLGGKFRDRLQTYAAVGGRSVSQLRDNAQRLLAEGHTVMTMGLGKGGAETYDIERVVAVSEVLKGKGQVLVDSLGAYTLHEATILGSRLDQLGNVGWWEDVLVPEDMEGYARLAEVVRVPITAGEQYSNRFQFRDLFRLRAADIVNPDVSRMGITEMKRIAIMADVHNVLFSPHQGMGSAPYRAASLHLAAAAPNFAILEGGNGANGPLVNPLLKEPFVYKGGYAEVPDRPGLGVEFDEKALGRVIVG